MIKEVFKELFTKTYIIIALIICILSFIIAYFYLPTLLNEGIQKRREYDKKHHLGWYACLSKNSFHYYNNEKNLF